LKDVRQIAVVGAGLMGHGIAQTFAQKGYLVSVYDLNKDILNQAFHNIKSNLYTFVEAGFENEARIGEILSHLTMTTELDHAVVDADFVIEAAPEDLDLKRDLFKDIDKYTPNHTILATKKQRLCYFSVFDKMPWIFSIWRPKALLLKPSNLAALDLFPWVFSNACNMICFFKSKVI
jgi:3-hydroxyacyl-CoA dehydrogenase